MQRILLVLLAFLSTRSLSADPVPVRYSQGTSHAFMVLRDEKQLVLATGDLVQTAHGDRVTSRLTFHFRDGSLDDETTIYTQRGTFHLLSDRHIQRGPSYPKPMQMLVDANGDVTIHDLSTPDGRSTTEHFDLPPDTSNGLYFTILANLLPSTPETKIAMIAASGKGRLVHLSIRPDGQDAYSVNGSKRKANIFRIHVEIGGLTGIVAPIVGKQPDDMRVWLTDGVAPTVVKGEAQLYEGGPLWRIELVSPSWPAETSPKH